MEQGGERLLESLPLEAALAASGNEEAVIPAAVSNAFRTRVPSSARRRGPTASEEGGKEAEKVEEEVEAAEAEVAAAAVLEEGPSPSLSWSSSWLANAASSSSSSRDCSSRTVPVAAASASGAEAASKFLRSAAGPSFGEGFGGDDGGDDDVALAPSEAAKEAAEAALFSPGSFSPFVTEDGRRSLKSSFSSMPAPSVLLARAETSASMSSVKGAASVDDDGDGGAADATMSKDIAFSRLERDLQGAVAAALER